MNIKDNEDLYTIEAYKKAKLNYTITPMAENWQFLLNEYNQLSTSQIEYWHIYYPKKLSDIIDVFDQRLTVKDVEYLCEWIEENDFQLKKWTMRDVLLCSDRALVEYIGQEYDTDEYQFIKDGWKEDRCELRGCTLTSGDTGYTADGRHWFCPACFEILRKKIVAI